MITENEIDECHEKLKGWIEPRVKKLLIRGWVLVRDYWYKNDKGEPYTFEAACKEEGIK